MTHSLTHLMNYEAVYRTAPATPGLLNIHTYTGQIQSHKGDIES